MVNKMFANTFPFQKQDDDMPELEGEEKGDKKIQEIS